MYDEFMKVALEEAKISLKEGNNGFGAVIITIIARKWFY